MIISFEHNFIFIKTAKTAGTSIEIALSKYCGPNDIITPISPKDEEIRKKYCGITAQNFKVPLKKYSLGMFWLSFKLQKRAQLKNHDSLFMAEKLFRINRGDFFCFTVERHPLEKIRSLADYWGQGQLIRQDCNSWLSKSAKFPKPHGWDLYANEQGIAVDRVFFKENLTELEDAFLKKTGLNLNLADIKTKVSSLGQSPQLNWNQDSLRRIRAAYAKELNAFHYEL